MWCEACGVGLCKGGGDKKCRRRDPRPAHIALILDGYGGTRTVVGTRRSIKANTRRDEWVHVVPGLIVHEPIAWNDIPIVIERARLEFEKWLDTRPNLDEDMHRAVTLYRLRRSEQPNSVGSLDMFDIIQT